MRPEISKAKTPTSDFFTSFGFGAAGFAASKLWDIAVFTLISQFSKAMVVFYVWRRSISRMNKNPIRQL